MLSPTQIEDFIADGYLRLDGAFSPSLAEACREILWRDMGCRRDDPASWTRPVVWLGGYHQPPFIEAANTPILTTAYDQLVGVGRWVPMQGLGTFPVRFPAQQDTGDTGWHIDASFPGPDSAAGDFLSWRVNVHSRGRALLALFLFSDVGEHDAPTRIRIGSHRDVARLLAPAGEAGIALRDLDLSVGRDRPEVLATGNAGTVYLCHPFLVHAAQVNRGHAPRFLAQPPLLPRAAFEIGATDAGARSPVETAICRALGLAS